jgi:hypothetical protein
MTMRLVIRIHRLEFTRKTRQSDVPRHDMWGGCVVNKYGTTSDAADGDKGRGLKSE